jgi:hypothetical protein
MKQIYRTDIKILFFDFAFLPIHGDHSVFILGEGRLL